MDDKDLLTHEIIGAAIDVSKALGVGLLEVVYETCLGHKIAKRGLDVKHQQAFPLCYDGLTFDIAFRPDLIVQQSVIVEVKAVKTTTEVHEAQLLTYMRLSGIHKGLLINFNAFPFAKGIKRMVL